MGFSYRGSGLRITHRISKGVYFSQSLSGASVAIVIGIVLFLLFPVVMSVISGIVVILAIAVHFATRTSARELFEKNFSDYMQGNDCSCLDELLQNSLVTKKINAEVDASYLHSLASCESLQKNYDVEKVLLHPSVAEVKTTSGATPLQLLVSGDKLPNYCLATILKHPAVAKENELNDPTPFHIIVAHDDLSSATCFIDILNHPDVAKSKSGTNVTPLHVIVGRPDLDRFLLYFEDLLRHSELAKVQADEGWTPLHLLANNENLPSHYLVDILNHPSIAEPKSDDGRTPLHVLSTQSYVVDFIHENLLQHPLIDTARDIDGQTPLHRIAENANATSIERILKHPSLKNVLDNQGESPFDLIPREFRPSSLEEIRNDMALSLRGMVSVDDFIKNFSFELNSFFEQKKKSRGIVLWGNPSVGKTEIAKRLCGLTCENNPSLHVAGLQFKYIACCDQDVNPKDILSEVENGTVLFLDEMDKYLSSESGVSTAAQAKGLRTSLVTNFNSKSILWIFIGTFADIRGSNNLTLDLLSNTLGSELSSRLDFACWKLKDWELNSLIEAAKCSALSKDINIEYADDALYRLCAYALENGGGVRTLERCHESIKRKYQDLLTQKDPTVVFTKTMVDQFISQETSGEISP